MDETIKCANCSKPVEAGYFFCPLCGSPLNQCSKCKNYYNSKDLTHTLCELCLSSEMKAQEKNETSEEAPISENEKAENAMEIYEDVTIMSVDIMGSTWMIQDLDAEEANNLIAPVFKVMKDTVEQYEGSIIQSAGDGVVASFGAPKRLEDHALFACMAAISMHEKAKLINEVIELRIGLHSGKILLEMLGNQTHTSYVITGETVDLATKIEKMTKPDSISISESTLNQLNNAQFFPLGFINSSEKKVNIYELKAVQTELQISVKVQSADSVQDLPQMENLRKHATVMFVRIKASSLTSDNHKLLGKCSIALKSALNAISFFTGKVIHLTSNEIVATFGAPQAVENHALRACLAALMIKEEVKSIDSAIEFYIGLNSGKIFLQALDDQKQKYDITGPTVNLAARMQQTAQSDTIQIAKNTYALVENSVSVTALGDAQIKGFKNKIELFELNSVKENRLFETENKPFFSAYKGREAEIHLFHESLIKVQNHKGMAIHFSAQAGQGKSRLCYELTHLEIVKDFNIYVTSGSYGRKNILLSPVINLFFDVFNFEKQNFNGNYVKAIIENSLIDEKSPLKLNSTLSLLGINPDDSSWDQMEPSLKRKNIFNTGIKILTSLSLQKPLILVIEDLHFIDNETESFLDQLIASIESFPLLILLTSRTEYQDHWSSRSNYIRAPLIPLYHTNGEEMLDELLGDDSSLTPIKSKILAEWDGNPFFLEEIVKFLVNNKILIGFAQNYHLNISALVERMQLPDTIFTVLQTQIDRLPLLQKRILEIGSVIGESFKINMILELMNIDIKELTDSLEDLCKSQLLCKERFYPEEAFAFKNLLIGEVCYNNVLLKTRKTLHAKLFFYFENIYKDLSQEQIQVMAHHAFLGEQWEKAFLYNTKAAEETFLMNALKLSMHFYKQALVASEYLENTLEIEEKIIYMHVEISHLLLRLGQFNDQEKHLKIGMKLAIASGHIPLQCTLYYFQTLFDLASKNVKEASEMAEHAYELALKSNSRDAMIVSQNALIHTNLFSGKYHEIYPLVNALIDSLPYLDYYPELCRVPFAYMSKTWMLLAQGRTGCFADVENDPKSILHVKTSSEINLSSFFIHLGIGLHYYLKGDYEKALFYLKNGLKISSQIDVVIGIPIFASLLGCICLREGKPEEGKQYIHQATNVGKVIDFTFISALFLDTICEGMYLTGNLQETKKWIDVAVKICEERQIKSPLPGILRIEAMVDFYLNTSDFVATEKKIKKSLEMAEELGLIPEKAHIHLTLANFYLESEKEKLFKSELSKALEIYNKLEMPYWKKYCEKLLTKTSCPIQEPLFQ